ncbi:MAG: DNA primase, partial [Clostridia bacterium]|nr:DNA primase [Clostridia bacterium]
FSSAGLKVRVLKLSGGKDPDEIIKKYGPERFRMILEGAQNEIEYTLIKIRSKHDPSTTDGKASFVTEAAAFLATLPNPIERDTYASKIAEETGVEKSSVMAYINSSVKKNTRKQLDKKIEEEKRKSLGLTDRINTDAKKNVRAAKAEENLLTLLLRNPDFWEKIKEKVSAEDFQTAFNKRVFTSLISKIESGAAIDVTAFGEEFSLEEAGRISLLFNKGDMVSNTEKECLDCIKVLKEEQVKQTGDVSGMDDEEFAKLIKNLKK